MEDKFLTDLYKDHQQTPKCPTLGQVSDFFKRLLGILFPELSIQTYDSEDALVFNVLNLKQELYEMLYMYPNRETINAESKAKLFFDNLPEIHRLLKTDIQAMYDGDPAAQSESEIIRTYPGFYAIAAYRIAHVLYKLDIKVIPRMITEFAHTKTGVDIHPGASIDECFCIDHGTGVVIGETCHIGKYVKIYQGVTLGALSVAKKLANSKRHPTIKDGVVIYAGATVLGGETVIGKESIIGGNTWVTKSVEAGSKVYYKG